MTDTKPQPAQTEFTAAGGAAFDAFRRSGGLTLAERWNSIAAAALSAAPVEYREEWAIRSVTGKPLFEMDSREDAKRNMAKILDREDWQIVMREARFTDWRVVDD